MDSGGINKTVMQKIVDLPNGRLLMVKVPNWALTFDVYRVNGEAIMLKWANPEYPLRIHDTTRLMYYNGDMKDFRWQLLGRPGEITEEKARTVVEGVGDFHSKLVGTYPESYWDYESNELLSGFTTTKSLQSLITSNGFNPDETVLLFEGNK